MKNSIAEIEPTEQTAAGAKGIATTPKDASQPAGRGEPVNFFGFVTRTSSDADSAHDAAQRFHPVLV